MGRRNRNRHQPKKAAPVATVRRENMLAQGAGANSAQDRGAMQSVPAQSTLNPYYQQNLIKRCQDYLKMYNTSWEAQKIITIPVDDAFKYRAELKGISEKDANELWKIYDDMDMDIQLRRALIQERLFGGCAAFGVFKMDAPTTSALQQPLRLRNIQVGDFEALNIIDITQLSQTKDTYNPFSAAYDRMPDLCIGGVQVDHSRLHVLDGNPVVGRHTRSVLEGGRYNRLGMGESKLSALYEIIKMATGTQEGAYHLINMSSVLLFEVEGLRSMQATNSAAEEALKTVAQQISIYRAALLDAKKMSISQHSASFGAVPELLMMYMQLLSAAGDVPATRYLGQAPGGLNATGESDLQNYYNMVRGNVQMSKLKPLQAKVFDWIGCSRWGYEAWVRKRVEFEIEYPELWNESAKDKAERLSIYAAALNGLVSNGVIDGETAIRELQKRDFFLTEVEAKVVLTENPLEDSPIDANNAIERLKRAARGEMKKLPVSKVNAGDWDEARHPRAEDGKFGKGSGQRKSSPSESPNQSAAKALREKLDSLSWLPVSAADAKNISKENGIMRGIVQWAEKLGIIGSYKNRDTGWENIAITRTSVRDVVRHKAGDGKIAALKVSPNLIKEGVYVTTTRRNDKGQSSHIFVGKVSLDGRKQLVGFVVTEDMNGKRYYNHELFEINKALGEYGSADTPSAETPANREPIVNILRRHLVVKSDDDKGEANG